MKTGRNEPCRCGSGKKYKKCCALQEVPKAENLLWHRLRASLDGLPDKILKVVVDTYGSESLLEAWEEFCCQKSGEPFDPVAPVNQLFMPWFFYHWTPDPEDTLLLNVPAEPLPPAALLLQKRGRHLDSLQRRYVEISLKSPFSFFEITRSEPGYGFHLKDILTGETLDVVEKSASSKCGKGDIVFAMPVTIDGLTILEGCSHFFIPPIRKKQVIDFRKCIQKNHNPILREHLISYDLDMIAFFKELEESLFNPRLPQMLNTDEDPLVPQKLLYDIDSPEAVFHALEELDFNNSKEDLLESAEFDAEGNLQEVKFQWLGKGNKKNKHWDNTVLGYIHIKGKRLTVEVNSEKRAERFKKELNKRIKEGVTYKTTLIEPIESALNSSRPWKGASASKEQEELMNHPEIQAELGEMMRKHWAGWVHEKVPALGDITPIEASKTEEGRELLESLLTQFERDTKEKPAPGMDPDIFQGIRKELGMPSSQ